MSEFKRHAPPEVTAACGAYLLVALADARVETIEEARFLGGVVNDRAFKTFAAEDLASEYNRLLALLRADWNGGQKEILDAVEAVNADATAIAAIKVAARHAVIADQVIREQEELVLHRIASALGLSKDDL